MGKRGTGSSFISKLPRSKGKIGGCFPSGNASTLGYGLTISEKSGNRVRLWDERVVQSRRGEV